MGLETAAIVGIAAAAGTAGGEIIGGKLKSNAERDAAKLQTDAANKAAEIRAQSDREALAFQKQQAAEDAQRFEETRRANYDQWAARQGYQSTVGSMLGLPTRQIPAYQSSLPGGSAQGMPTGANPQIEAFIADYKSKHPASEGIAPLAAAVAKQFPGVGRFDYGAQGGLSNNELNIPGYGKYKVLGGEDSPSSAYWYVPGTNDAAPGAAPMTGGYLSPMSSLIAPPPSYVNRPLTPALRAPGVY